MMVLLLILHFAMKFIQILLWAPFAMSQLVKSYLTMKKTKYNAKSNLVQLKKGKLNFNIVRPSDWFTAEIKSKNGVLSDVFGSYLSFIEFDNVRYWDIRESTSVNMITNNNQINSSSIHREDRNHLINGNMREAQIAKDKLEGAQRNDAKLRKLLK